MGGNAVNHLGNVIRLKTKEFDELALDIVALLSTDNTHIYPIPSYYSKEDHGDMDLLTTSDFWKTNTRNSVKKKLGSVGFFQNGTVTSYAVPYGEDIFQVDIIHVPEEKFDFAYNYFSWNDAGNLLGRIAHYTGFKLGHLGLQYILRDPDNSDHVVSELTVTNDWNTALEFLCYDAKKYRKGFNNLTDIFEFVINNKFAHRDIFLLENRNNVSRTRDRKRKTYMEFLKWLETNDTKKQGKDKTKVREEMLTEALGFFPSFSVAYYSAMDLFKKKQRVNKIVNGTVIAEMTGYSGEELGSFISVFREAYTINELYILSDEEIYKKLSDFHDEWKETSGY